MHRLISYTTSEKALRGFSVDRKGDCAMNNEGGHYSVDEKNRFIIENYNWAKPFSNFFPGIGGRWGIPLWAYYVNRAQGISSIGVHDKDSAIMEFFSFNKACHQVGLRGFRTFIRVDKKPFYEPFIQTKEEGIKQTMAVSAETLVEPA